MKKIENVSLIGLGGLGIMYAEHIRSHIPYSNLRIVADQSRINRYKNEGIYCNDILCDFNYVTPEEDVEKADLIIFAVKYNNLDEAIESMEKHVGENTIIISVLNGIVSERDIATKYSREKLLYCVAQGMTASKKGNKGNYKNKGIVCYGELNENQSSRNVLRLQEFFERIELPYEIDNHMERKLWNKLMANVGINQTVAYYQASNAIIQKVGEPRTMMIQAMEEVIQLAEYEGVNLKQDDISYWLTIIDGLNPDGMPSMAQDIVAGRKTEIVLFAGTIVELGKKHGLDVPINSMFLEHFS